MSRTPTIGNMPGADLPVTFPVSGETRIVNMIVLLAEVHDAEAMAKFGSHLAPNAKNIAQLREKYELDWFASEVYPKGIHTWEQCAAAMRHFYNVCNDHIKGHTASEGN